MLTQKHVRKEGCMIRISALHATYSQGGRPDTQRVEKWEGARNTSYDHFRCYGHSTALAAP